VTVISSDVNKASNIKTKAEAGFSKAKTKDLTRKAQAKAIDNNIN
jgi:hypothetical protein